MSLYRITITGYVDYEISEEEEREGTYMPQTYDDIEEALYAMDITIGDIRGLELAIRPVTAAARALEEQQLRDLIQAGRDAIARLSADVDQGRHDVPEQP